MRVEVLQKLLGHKSIELTMRYAKLSAKTREQDYFRAMQIIEQGGNCDEGCEKRATPLFGSSPTKKGTRRLPGG